MEITVVWSSFESVPVTRTITVPDRDPLDACEDMFACTNLYEGGTWDALQPLPEGRNHTALSVGDHVIVDGTPYRCMIFGFAPVQEVVPFLRGMEESA